MNRRGALAAASAIAFAAACGGGGLARVGDEPATTRSAVVASLPDAPSVPIEPTRYLRQLSLDLRGRPPDLAELEDVARTGVVDDARIDAMLRSPEFLAQARAWHRALLWPNVSNYPLGMRALSILGASGEWAPIDEVIRHPEHNAGVFVGDARRGPSGTGCDFMLEYPPPAARGAQPTYAVVGTDGVRRTYPYYDPRGVPLPYHDAVHCPNDCSADAAGHGPFSSMNADGADAQPHELDPKGKHCPAAFPHRVINACDLAASANPAPRREGYRRVVHYWSRGVAVKTCATDAQTREVALDRPYPCSSGESGPTCGCGPDGVYCAPTVHTLGSPVTTSVERAMEEEPLEIVASVIDRDEDYFDVLTTRRSFVDGPLAFFFRKQAPFLSAVVVGAPASSSQLPEVPYDDESWHEYERGPEHAGVLTTSEYLLRFPTWRSRVSQFRTAFMCRPFTPISDAMPGPDDACTREPNLAKRCGCKNCHVAIEPMGAWFGRWVERGAKYLDPREVPTHDPTCEACLGQPPCESRCRAYFTDPLDAESARYAGMLRGYVYRTPEEVARIDEGPRGLVASAIATGELEACTVATTWATLMGRAMTSDERRARLPALERDFDAAHRSFRALVRAIVTSPEYRRGP